MSLPRTLSPHRLLKLTFGMLFSLAAAIGVMARDDVPTVVYKPSLKLIEGDQPLSTSYVLSITSPANVPTGANLSISPIISLKR